MLLSILSLRFFSLRPRTTVHCIHALSLPETLVKTLVKTLVENLVKKTNGVSRGPPHLFCSCFPFRFSAPKTYPFLFCSTPLFPSSIRILNLWTVLVPKQRPSFRSAFFFSLKRFKGLQGFIYVCVWAGHPPKSQLTNLAPNLVKHIVHPSLKRRNRNLGSGLEKTRMRPFVFWSDERLVQRRGVFIRTLCIVYWFVLFHSFFIFMFCCSFLVFSFIGHPR